ncbi:MAG TPA: type II toxin-antitoxin system VapC family toxin [Thermoanaerobaculia bacterium]|nr:type II toxin-antitoxin system VapC family toxin [Thermoanaerobaculia bacterium]
MIVVDSSGWIEFFTDGALADDYASKLRNLAAVVTPVIVIYEVYKRLKRDLSEDDALVAISGCSGATLLRSIRRIALTAADLSLEHRLAMADAIVLATARKYRAELVTSDQDFEALDGVTYLPKKARDA